MEYDTTYWRSLNENHGREKSLLFFYFYEVIIMTIIIVIFMTMSFIAITSM